MDGQFDGVENIDSIIEELINEEFNPVDIESENTNQEEIEKEKLFRQLLNLIKKVNAEEFQVWVNDN